MSLLKYNVTPSKARVVDDRTEASQLMVNQFKSTHSVPSDLVELASEVARADESVRSMAGGKLTIVAEQIRFLQEQAKKVLEDAREDALLHKAQCNFVKQPGTTYYMYLRHSGNSYFSMLGPHEWKECPHQFLGAYRLEYDRSWTKQENIARKDQEISVINNLLNRTQLPSLEYIASAAPQQRANGHLKAIGGAAEVERPEVMDATQDCPMMSPMSTDVNEPYVEEMQ